MGRPPKVPVMLMLDGYPAIARDGFPIVENNLGDAAACGVKLWTVWQDLAQLRSLYGDGFESFISSLRRGAVVRAAGSGDGGVSQPAHRADGAGTGGPRPHGPGRADSQFQGGTVSYQPVPRMLAQDLRNMDEGFSVIFSHKVRNTVRAFMPIPSAPARRRSLLGVRARADMKKFLIAGLVRRLDRHNLRSHDPGRISNRTHARLRPPLPGTGAAGGTVLPQRPGAQSGLQGSLDEPGPGRFQPGPHRGGEGMPARGAAPRSGKRGRAEQPGDDPLQPRAHRRGGELFPRRPAPGLDHSRTRR